jgi:hypothetical protein
MGSTNIDRPATSYNQNNSNSIRSNKSPHQDNKWHREQDDTNNNNNHNNNPIHFTFKSEHYFPKTLGNSHNAPYSSGSNNNNYNNNQYELAAVVPNQNSQLNYNNQQPPAYAASASQGYAQSSPVVYAPSRDHSDRPLRTYSDKPSTSKPYQPDNDVDAPSSYSNSPSYDYSPKPRPASYAAVDDSSYEVEETPRPRKTHKRPAAYVEESVDEDSYSRPSPRPKYVSSEPDSDSYPGLDGATGYQPDLSDIGKTASASLPSYASDALDESDYASLGLQAYSSPSLPQSELSYLMSKMPRGFHPVPAASSYGLTDLHAPRPRPYPFGLPSRPAARRPYLPGPYAPSPYLKVSVTSFAGDDESSLNEADLFSCCSHACNIQKCVTQNPYAGAAYPAPPPRYLPAASFRSYSSIPYYGAGEDQNVVSHNFSLMVV